MILFKKAGKKFYRNSLTGFTLVEVLVTTVVLSLLLMGILAVLNSSDMTWNVDMGLVELQQQTRQAMAGMIREIRQAGSVNITTIIPTQDSIDFSIPGSCANCIRYYLDTNTDQILREYEDSNGSETTIVLANNINVLNFCCKGGVDCFDCSGITIVEVQIKAQKTVKGRTIIFPVPGNDPATEEYLVERVKLRN